SVFQLVLRGIHCKIPLSILLFSLDSTKGSCNVLLTMAQEPSDPNNQLRYATVLVQKHILNRANFGVSRIIDVLIIVVLYGNRIGNARHRFLSALGESPSACETRKEEACNGIFHGDLHSTWRWGTLDDLRSTRRVLD